MCFGDSRAKRTANSKSKEAENFGVSKEERGDQFTQVSDSGRMPWKRSPEFFGFYRE
jgi:hypothetical protein